MGLSVLYSRDERSDRQYWHVVVEQIKRSFPLDFIRKKDAELAMKSIENELDWDGSCEEVVEACYRYGPRKLLRRMIEALQW